MEQSRAMKPIWINARIIKLQFSIRQMGKPDHKLGQCGIKWGLKMQPILKNLNYMILDWFVGTVGLSKIFPSIIKLHLFNFFYNKIKFNVLGLLF